jgi:hypothetical protein
MTEAVNVTAVPAITGEAGVKLKVVAVVVAVCDEAGIMDMPPIRPISRASL